MAMWTFYHFVPKFSRTLLSLTLLLFIYIIMILLISPEDSENEMQQIYHRVRCSRLRTKISNMTSTKKLDMQVFSSDIISLKSCSIKPNITYTHTLRVLLSLYCNASGSLFLTQKNTEVNQNIPYETNANTKYKITPAVYSKLPQDMPWVSRSLARCAVVGSGGILLNSSCGKHIDSADFIIRFNLAQINSSDVGEKCDLMNINPSQIRQHFPNFMKNSTSLKTKLDEYNNSSFMIAAFAYTFSTKLSVNLLQVLWPEYRLLFFSPSYLKTLHQFWRGRGLKAPRLSTGFMLISVALELCEQVDVYGYWPFNTDVYQRPVQYHYYDKQKPNTRVHSMPEEFLRLLQLHSQGALTLHMDSCT